VRIPHLSLVLAVALRLAAGERAVPGPETILGDSALAPIGQPFRGNTSTLATDGDEVVVVWAGRSSLYAQRLDRFGARVTPLPSLLVRSERSAPVDEPRVFFSGGLYTVFYDRFENARWETWALRLTRELEIVEQRRVSADFSSEIVQDGDEFLLVTGESIVRIRNDFSVVATSSRRDAAVVVPSPHGTLLVAKTEPAISARMLDDSISVRVTSGDRVQAMDAVWTGTQYLVVWMDCPYTSCTTRLLALDASLAVSWGPVDLERTGCTYCHVEITKLGNDDSYITWPAGPNTRGIRVRGELLPLPTPMAMGTDVRMLYSAHGLLFTVDSGLNVRTFSPGANVTPSTLPVLSTPLAAVEESIIAVAGSPGEAAIVRQRPDASNIASIVDRDGRVLREVSLPTGREVSLGHDGKDFYALVSTSFETRFLKVEKGAVEVKLPFIPEPTLIWADTGFIILQSNYRDYTGTMRYRSRFLWLTREGQVELPPCENWEFPTSADLPPVVVQAGEEIAVAVGPNIALLRNNCQTGPPQKLTGVPYQWRPVWQDEMWAWLVTSSNRVDLATAASPSSPPVLHHSAHDTVVYSDHFDLAPIKGRWVAAYSDRYTLRAAVHNADGALIGTSILAEKVEGRPYLARVSDRVLAVYARQVFEAPYLGVNRVVVAPLTLESEGRRRLVRP
jgi:hypothetical protein